MEWASWEECSWEPDASIQKQEETVWRLDVFGDGALTPCPTGHLHLLFFGETSNSRWGNQGSERSSDCPKPSSRARLHPQPRATLPGHAHH